MSEYRRAKIGNSNTNGSTTADNVSFNDTIGSGTTDVQEALEWIANATGAADTFESISKNLKAYPFSITYLSDQVSTIQYSFSGSTITKTFNYTLGELTSIVLSGDVPSGVNLRKQFNYDGSGNISNVTYLSS